MTDIDEIAVSSDEEEKTKNRTGLLVYRRQSSTVELHTDSLEDGKYLKDDIVQFYLTYLLNEVCPPKDKNRIHIFDSIFTQQLDKAFQDDNIDVGKLRQLRKWYDRIDIFTKDFLIFPICREQHWLVILVCYPGSVQALNHKKEEEEKEDEKDKILPAMIVMDSLGMKKYVTTSKVRDFLDYDWRSQLKEMKRFSHGDLKDYFPKLPRQNNTYDCGLYMLMYIRSFLMQPDKFYRTIIDGDGDSLILIRRDIRNFMEVHTRDAIKNLIRTECSANGS